MNIKLRHETFAQIAGITAALGVTSHIIGIDIDLVFLGLSGFFSIAFSFAARSLKKTELRELTIVLLFGCLVMVSTGYNLGLMFVLMLILLGSLVPKNAIFFDAFLNTLLLSAFIGGISVYLELFSSGLSRQNYFSTNPVWMSWLLGFGFIIVSKDITTIKNMALGGVFLGALILSGSRAPLAAAIFCAFVLGTKKSIMVRSAVSFIVVFAAIYLLPKFRADLLDKSGFLDDSSRIDLWEYAFESIILNPFGYGYESFLVAHFHYPHNLLLEVVYTHGVVVGSLFLLVFLARSIFLLTSYHFLSGVICKLFFFTFIVSLFSGEIFSHRLLFFLVGCVLSMSLTQRKILLSTH